MPELPEVETVRRGLEPIVTGARILRVDQRRPDLRFPFPERLQERLLGAQIEEVRRRAKYLLFPLSTGQTMLAHLGMTGRFSLHAAERVLAPGAFYATDPPSGHEHLLIGLDAPTGPFDLVYSDPRRFGFVELLSEEEAAKRFDGMGTEPLSDAFTPDALLRKLAGKATPMKAALLDQRVVAGLGNIYVCEALYRAGISPRRLAKSLGRARAERLVPHIKAVLGEAIAAGGSTLRDYAGADGREGAFQQRFDVYDRAGAACRRCGGTISRYVQSGRSTFACGGCQR
jgi:formamidopyrimidine-DNA glycosylase